MKNQYMELWNIHNILYYLSMQYNYIFMHMYIISYPCIYTYSQTLDTLKLTYFQGDLTIMSPPPATWRSTRTTTGSIQYFGEDSQFGKFLGGDFSGFQTPGACRSHQNMIKLHVGGGKLHITTIFVGKAKVRSKRPLQKKLPCWVQEAFNLMVRDEFRHILSYIYICLLHYNQGFHYHPCVIIHH